MNRKKTACILAVGLSLFSLQSRAQDDFPRRPPPPRGEQPSHRYSLEQALSDRAQLNTIAFNGFAFITGDFASDTFLPPGKVSDYFGFQYLRDIDRAEQGHSKAFLTRIALNMLNLMEDSQKNKLIQLATHQQADIRRFATLRWPLIQAFRQALEQHDPAGRKRLNQKAIEQYSAELYALDGKLAYQRAQVMAEVFRSFSPQQRNTLNRLEFGNSSSWGAVDEQNRLRLPHEVDVAVMTYASELFSWVKGSVKADTYFCPERHGMYFGGFGLKTAPALRQQANYSISTRLTGDKGEAFLTWLSPEQQGYLTRLIPWQKKTLQEIVHVRQAISVELRQFLKGESADFKRVMVLSKRYGELDGRLSYGYATAFAEIARRLTPEQKNTLWASRERDPRDPQGPFLYATPTRVPALNTQRFFQ